MVPPFGSFTANWSKDHHELLRSSPLVLILLEDEICLQISFKVSFIYGGMIFGLIIDQHDHTLLWSLCFLLNHLSGQRLHTSTYIYGQKISNNCKKNKNNCGAERHCRINPWFSRLHYKSRSQWLPKSTLFR